MEMTGSRRFYGTIVNGDLTEYWHRGQIDAWKELYKSHVEDEPIGKLPKFIGLGNHDYYNNVCDCLGTSVDRNHCARAAVNAIRDQYKDVSWIAFDPCSLAYSFDVEGYRFVQLHLWPGYTVDIGEDYSADTATCLSKPNRFQPSKPPPQSSCENVVLPSWGWLRSRLSDAADPGKNLRSVLLLHTPRNGTGDPYWPLQDVNDFKDIVSAYNVVAIFAGHIHGDWGRQDGYRISNLTNSKGQTVPLFLSGSSEYNRFLVAEFGPQYMNVGVVCASSHAQPGLPRPSDCSRPGSPPVFEEPTNGNMMMTYVFP